MNNQIPTVVRQAVLAKLTLLEGQRSQLDVEIAQLKGFLGEEQGVPMPESETSITRQILDFAAANIRPGIRMTTEKIYHLMIANGVKFPEGKDPKARITRVLSGTKMYKGHKTLGWSLKGEEPAATGS